MGRELAAYAVLVASVCAVDVYSTVTLMSQGASPYSSKILASGIALVFNFLGRRFIVFPEKRPGDWRAAESSASGPQPAVIRRTPTVPHGNGSHRSEEESSRIPANAVPSSGASRR
jgi:hypothetical protein